MAYVGYVSTRHPTHRADVAVILGTTVNPDGTVSERLEYRLRAGLALYQQGLADYLMVSGGLGKEGHYEGDKMRDFLLAQGVPADRIIVDNQGNNTWLTVQNFQALQPQYAFTSVIVVSQYFHLPRTIRLFERIGIQDVQSHSPFYFEWRDIFSVPREFVAFYVYWLKY